EGSQKGQMQNVLELAKEQGVLVQHVPKRKLDQLIGHENHQGVVASVAAYEYAEMDDLFQRAAEKGEEPFFIVLDEVEDPHNLGSILRTADAAGVHGVIIPKRRAVGLTQTVAKASTGAIEYVPVVRVTNLARTMEDLKKRGLWFIGTDAKGSEDYRGAAYDMPIALVIGSEGKGLSRLVREKCDFLVRIPMVGQVTSLNASVATSLLMYEAYRKRHPLGRE
ncbi:23S rRNA (guanosine(2251)-2'-O)-methyltransferase RlmB, partial [Halalkalibacterium halodurans]|uniref:23S rRNA (guanosine(2251)-2'-O)-methyltransferase RlmB n=1 Tax=Halalkalibacterium halodurans TaxID=86665 RepID=UPI002E1A70CD